MQKKKIRSIALTCFLAAVITVGQGISFAKDAAEGTTEQEQQTSEEVKNWGGGYEDCTHRA